MTNWSEVSLSTIIDKNKKAIKEAYRKSNSCEKSSDFLSSTYWLEVARTREMCLDEILAIKKNNQDVIHTAGGLIAYLIQTGKSSHQISGLELYFESLLSKY